MRVLLSDGSGMTARQVATQLSASGHAVEVLTPDPLALTRFTRHVRRLHRVPRFGTEPFAWLDAAIATYRTGSFDVLIPTQEQVAVLARSVERLRESGVATAVPPFEALVKVQDKLAARATLSDLGLPQPDSSVVLSAADLADWRDLPVFVKAPIGTATTGVRYVAEPAQMAALAQAWQAAGLFADGGVLVQSPVAGQLAMIQAVFCNGALVAWHANLRVREGSSGGASHKRSIDLPAARDHLLLLGQRLGWHGALSADAILTDDGPVYIDINPRLVEPGNAWRAGVDLVAALLEVAAGAPPVIQAPGRSGVATHQLMLAVVGAAQHEHTRRAVLTELASASRHQSSYKNSVEELTPLRNDLRTAFPVMAVSLATLAWPGTWRWLTSGTVTSYALTPEGWHQVLRNAK
jgi:biotin carboxylase